MKKSLTVFAFATLLCAQAFAAYVIVLKDGTRYNAKAKWTVQNGKALITLETGQTMTINANDIDVAKTDAVNKLGLGNVSVIGQEQTPETTAQKQAADLGQLVRARRGGPVGASGSEGVAPVNGTAPLTPIADQLDGRIKDTFERAYENVGIFEHKMTGTNNNVRVELTADSEDKVFNAVSASAFLIVRNAGVESIRIDQVDLIIKTTMGGNAGRFAINRADAEAINNKQITLPEYFVRKVIY
jgi:hypothetical protein